MWYGYSSQVRYEGLGCSSEVLFDSKPEVKQTLYATLAGSDLRDINTEVWSGRPHCLMKTSSKQSKRRDIQLEWLHRETKHYLIYYNVLLLQMIQFKINDWCVLKSLATLTAGFFLHVASKKALVDDEPKDDNAPLFGKMSMRSPHPPPTPIFHLPLGNLYFLWHWPLSCNNSMEKAIHRQTAFSSSRMRMSAVRSDFFWLITLFCPILKRTVRDKTVVTFARRRKPRR